MKTRQINKAKRVSRGCRNHGSCGYCNGSRTHQAKRAVPADEKEQLEEGRQDLDFEDDSYCQCSSCLGPEFEDWEEYQNQKGDSPVTYKLETSLHILDENHKPVPAPGPHAWEKFYASEARIVGADERDGVRVSTVFLGLDHGFGRRPMWFETMVFGGPLHQEMERYETWEEAKLGHQEWRKKALSSEVP